MKKCGLIAYKKVRFKSMYKARHFVDVYVDDYEQGQSNHVNYWEEEKQAKTKDELIEKICETLMCTKEEFFKYSNFEQLNNYDYAFEVFANVFVDVDNYKPTKKDVELWKQGKKKLYTQNHHILISEVIEKPFDITKEG